MSELAEGLAIVLRREWIYLWYYFTVQLEQIAPHWGLGMVLGSVISMFGKARIHSLFQALNGKKPGILGVIPASLLGIASLLCMYGTIPIAASFSQKGMRDDPPFAAVAVVRHEYGKRVCVYAYRACYQDYQSVSVKDCAGREAFCILSGLCECVRHGDRVGGELGTVVMVPCVFSI